MLLASKMAEHVGTETSVSAPCSTGDAKLSLCSFTLLLHRQAGLGAWHLRIEVSQQTGQTAGCGGHAGQHVRDSAVFLEIGTRILIIFSAKGPASKQVTLF